MTTDDAAPPPPELPTGSTRVTDPRAMRALAHPVRLRLLGELRVRGPQSVGMLGELLDEPPGSVSYHVGVLARHGFVLEAPERARDRRERWWRAAARTTSFDPAEAHDDPERRLAMDGLRRAVHHRYAALLEEHLAAEPAMPREWVAASTSGDEQLSLTLDQLVELRRELHDLAHRWAARSDPAAPGARRVSLVYHGLPW
ncbi:helix-turn-helix domain-containing protein [Pseudokineococcus sp. 5B2Z-1]|uniref:helix-turn-helix domain-containing protein n=1 Tax=Pseudokineococcus sp. 5B2Z-1 TaxID=3132744 RepID=UPI0030A6ACC7